MEGFRGDRDHGRSEDEAAVRGVIESWTAAVRRRDIGEILKNHSPDIVMFDVPPRFDSAASMPTGRHGTWDMFFSWTSDPIPFDVTDMSVTARSDVAFVFAAMACAEPGSDRKPKPLAFA